MDPLELARVFVKTAVRMFYETEHVVVVDALVFHGALSLADIAIVLDYGKQLKTAQKLCGKLKEAGLISVFARPELRDGAMKAITREYYFIDYRRAIDATKYRLHMLDEKIKENIKPSQEKKEFYCPQCKAQWTTMEVLDKVDFYGRGAGFLCKQCDHPLESIHSNGTTEPENDDTPAKFNRQFGPLLKLMQQIDQVTIPAIEGEDAVSGAIELPRDKDINPVAKHEPVPVTTVRPTAVRGIVPAPEKIEVSIATDREWTEADRAAESVRLAKIAQQNQLPEWHTKSTVYDKEFYSANGTNGTQNSGPSVNGVDTPSLKADPDSEDVKGRDPTLDAVFDMLKAEQERQAREAELEEEEEDDDEFEDVVGAGISNSQPEAKRIKLDSSAVSTPQIKVEASSPAAASSPAGAGEESEEDEFEDAM